MLRKSQIARAILLLFSSQTHSAIDLDKSEYVSIAEELVGSQSITLSDSGGAGALTINLATGYNAALSDTYYVRFDLSNATFNELISVNDLIYDADGNFEGTSDQANNADGSNFSVTIEQGGTTSDNFVVFGVVDSDNQISDDAGFVFSNVSGNTAIDVDDPQQTVSVPYRVWGGVDGRVYALNELDGAIKDTGFVSYIEFVSGNSGDIDLTNDSQLQADVATDTKTWLTTSGGAQSTTLANLGALDLSSTGLVSGVLNLTGGALVGSDIYDSNQALNLSGDFSFGAWHLDSGSDCGTSRTTIEIDTTLQSAIAASADYTGSPYYLCVTVDAQTKIPEVTQPYSIFLENDEATATLSSIGYNSTYVELNFVTTYDEYEQRILLINDGSFDAAYQFTFVGESGTTCSAVYVADSNDADGSIPANKTVELLASNIVSTTGTSTRCAAKVRVDAPADKARVSTTLLSGSHIEVNALTSD